MWENTAQHSYIHFIFPELEQLSCFFFHARREASTEQKAEALTKKQSLNK